MPSTYYVAWWNLENLFDEENSPRRTEKVARVIGNDIAGWTPALRDRKVAQLASVIGQMNEGDGPDLLGVCEVENRFVLDLLADALARQLRGRRYGIVHADTQDARGIDVAFLYDPASLTAPEDEVFFHVVMRRNATREIVQVNFRTRQGRTWTVFGNHWPSRSGGAFESSGYRHIAGETLSYFHQRAREVHGDATPVMAMGDFNAEPFDTSLVLHALSTRQQRRVAGADTPRLWNLMWPSAGIPDGTFYFDNEPNLFDQFLVNANMARQDSPIRVEAGSVDILRFPGTFDTGTYPRPVPFGGIGKPVDENGFSDHFPIGMRITEADLTYQCHAARQKQRAHARLKTGTNIKIIAASAADRAVCRFMSRRRRSISAHDQATERELPGICHRLPTLAGLRADGRRNASYCAFRGQVAHLDRYNPSSHMRSVSAETLAPLLDVRCLDGLRG